MAFFSKRSTTTLSLTLVLLLLTTTGCSPQSSPPPVKPGVPDGRSQVQQIGKERLHTAAKNVRWQPDIGELPDKPPKTKLELTSKRTRHSTRFVNPDGSFTEEVYAEPQFYQDKSDKKMKMIDNTVSLKNGKYENKANEFAVRFSPKAASGELIRIENDKNSMVLEPVGAIAVQAKTQDNVVTYPGLFANTNAEYVLKSNFVKENLILQTPAAPNKFSYEVRLSGLTPKQEPTGEITFRNANNQVAWVMSKPFLSDSAGKQSDKVTQTLRTAAGKTFVDLQADTAFLQDPQTKFPVTLDPTVNSWDVMVDTFGSGANPTATYGSYPNLFVGKDPTYGTTRALFSFFLPSLPSDSRITSATFSAYQTATNTTNTAVDVLRNTADFSSAATWNTLPTTNATPEDTVNSNTTNAYWTWTITSLVKDWYNGVLGNFGVTLKSQNETTAPARQFNSVNATTNTPRLTINYSVDPAGLEHFWTYTPEGVNVSNGNLVKQTTDIELTGTPQISVVRTYNSRKGWYAGQFGWGWVSNYDMRIVDAGKGPITVIDEDSTRHIFGQRVGGGFNPPAGIDFTLVKNADNTYTITDKENRVYQFGTNGRLTSIADEKGNLVTVGYDASTRVKTLTDANNRVITFNYGTNGYVSSLVDPANHTVSYTYDTAGNLTKVTDQVNQSVAYTYDSTHRMTSFSNWNGSTNTLDYDTSDRVTALHYPITIGGTQQSSDRTIAYDTANAVTTYTDAQGTRADYSYNPNGNVIQLIGNPTVPAAKSVGTYTYDNNNNQTSMIDPNANKTDPNAKYVYTYDAASNQTGVQLPGTETSTAQYDERNNIVTRKDFFDITTNYGYDVKNNLTEISTPQIAVGAKRYDDKGRLTGNTNPLSIVDNLAVNSSFETDANADGWPDHWVRNTETGKTATFTWANGGRFGNKAISIANPTGWATVNTDVTIPYTAGDKYVVSGYIKTANTTSSAIIKMEFLNASDSWLGQQISNKIVGTQDWTRIQAVLDTVPANTTKIRVAVGMDPGTGTATFDGIQFEKAEVLSAYNLLENPGFERDSDGDKVPDGWSGTLLATGDGIDTSTTVSGTNALKLSGESGKNKSLSQRIPLTGDASTVLTLSGWGKQTGANPSGGSFSLQVTLNYTDGTTDATNSNEFSKTATDWQHVATRVVPKKAFSSVDLLYQFNNQSGTAYFDASRLEFGNAFTFYEYDNAGHQTKITSPSGTVVSYTYDTASDTKTGKTSGTNQTFAYGYDARNMLTKVTDPLQGVTSYTYNPAGDVTSITDPRKNTTTITYNELGRQASTTDPLNNKTTFDFDKNGNTTLQNNPNGTTIGFTYNESREHTQIAYNGTPQYTFTYDPFGNQTSFTDASGVSSTFAYNTNTLRTQEKRGSTTVNYGYNPNGQTTSIEVNAATTSTTSFTYNTLKQMLTIARNGSNVSRFVYDDQGNPISTIRVNGMITTREFDTSNRLLNLKTYKPDGTPLEAYAYSFDANNSITGITTDKGAVSYQYDALDRLTQETLPDGTKIVYTYDAAGNRTQKAVTKSGTTTTTAYTYDAANQMQTAGGKTYTYDKNGNLLSDGTKTYVYDAADRLTQVKDASGTVLASFAYEFDGRLTRMITPTGTLNFFYDVQESSPNSVAETDANNNIVAEYTFDSQGSPITMTRGGYTYHYIVNGHGDVTALTDSTGAVVATYTYDAYGNILSQTGSLASANPYRYAGYRYDEATGLYDLRARYYDASTGRFLTRDKQMGDLSAPETLNLYAYASDNPIKYTDPTGHWRYWGHWCGPNYGSDGEEHYHLDRICHYHDICYSQKGYFACSCDNTAAYKAGHVYYWKMWWKEKIAATGFLSWFGHGNCKWWL
ncbi:DNRLRE domain-containing protein [Tumebacillus sp. ITR2]|uniref:DNRLRE domain-containing protein n=1 Tax=Tumebacillus amylolyticus TaxID=2801339 RepID=A0ABS1J6N7_9BACL|nr:DNRLRE domain-containing protein [Tumebacillus amylolyticus]MBL0385943.1 DNRLRE domain-containing protein [Tumebacillus amylolyticus]